MHTILTLLRKDFAILRRNRSALVLTLAVPMIRSKFVAFVSNWVKLKPACVI